MLVHAPSKIGFAGGGCKVLQVEFARNSRHIADLASHAGRARCLFWGERSHTFVEMREDRVCGAVWSVYAAQAIACPDNSFHYGVV